MSRKKIRIDCLLPAFLMMFTGLAFLPASAASLVEIQMHHRAAEEALPAVEQLLTTAGRVTADRRNNSLLVMDTEEALDRVREFVSRFDQPVAQLRVHVRFEENAVDISRSLEAEGRIEMEKGSIGTPSAKTQGVALQVDAGRRTRDERSDYSLLVASGSSAFILTATDIPYRIFWTDLRRRYARAGSFVEFHRIDTGFEVRPTQAGEHVLLEITPRISSPAASSRNGQVVRFTEASTRLRVPLGRWVAIGDVHQEKNSALQEVVKAGESEGRQIGRIFLMVEKE